jgi:hypothetical protein
VLPVDRRVIPARWSGLVIEHNHALALTTADIAPGSVQTNNLATEAVTKIQTDAGFGTVNQDLPIASAVIGSSSAFTSQGGPLLVTATVRYYFEKYVNASNPTCAIRQFSGVTSAINLERSDGTLLVAGFIREALADGNFANKENAITLTWKDTRPAGTHTYRVRVDNFACVDGGTQLSGTAGARMNANGQIFTIMELKR